MPKQIKIGDLHLYVQGLLYLEKDDLVVENKLRFLFKEGMCHKHEKFI